MIRLRHNLQWLVRRQRGHGRSGNRLALATAITIIVSYLTVVLACACIEGKYLGFSSSQPGAYANVTQEIPAHNADKDLCGFMRAQMLTLPASSAVSVLSAKALFLDLLSDDKVQCQTVILDACRPPGSRFVPATELSFHSYSVLRI